ncbi:MAG TPA: SDR family oxidoreductase [Myxococcota bacterium]|nr:SDR family oxidoreductase [Myxococcota bacterium]
MILDRFRLDGKVAIVTGAGRGIGAGIALAFAEAGADVAVASRTQKEIDEVAAQIRALGRRAISVPCDVMQRAELESLVERTQKELGGVDLVVNNAGGAPWKPFLQTSERVFEEAYRFNVTSAFLLSRFAVPRLLERGGGAIVNVSSAMGRVTDRGFSAYGAAKAGLSHLTRLLATELAPRVRVNALAVGAVETSALAPFLAAEGMREKMESLTPLRRIGQPEDIGAAAVWLASPAGAWVTGKVIEVDGGQETTNFPLHLPDL